MSAPFWSQALWVGAGGFFGSIGRFGLNTLVVRASSASALPWATFGANALGCFAIGALGAWAERAKLADGPRLFLFVGLLGGFTTFSSFGWETCSLWRDGAVGLALANALGTLLVCLAAVGLGYALLRP